MTSVFIAGINFHCIHSRFQSDRIHVSLPHSTVGRAILFINSVFIAGINNGPTNLVDDVGLICFPVKIAVVP